MSEEFSPAPEGGAVIESQPSQTPELGSQTPVAEKPVEAKPAAPKTAEEAIRNASEKLKAKEADAAKAKEAPKDEVKPEQKAEAKPVDRTRSEDGKFAAKESTDSKSVEQRAVQEKTEGNQTSEGRKPPHDAPARFNDAGKRDWANAPDSVKEEVHRVISENEKGIQKYKESAERFEKVREFDDLARRNGREGVHESLKQVVEIEQAFKRDPIEGLKKITDHFGLNLEAVAAHIVGQNPNQQLSEAYKQINELKAEISRRDEEAKAPQIVQDFFDANPDAEQMADDIAFVLKNGIVGDLEAAHEYVKRFKPASNAGPSSQPLIPAESAPAQTQAPALNPAGSKSVSGAPGGGISPSSKQPVSKDPMEAVKRAMARAG